MLLPKNLKILAAKVQESCKHTSGEELGRCIEAIYERLVKEDERDHRELANKKQGVSAPMNSIGSSLGVK